MTDRGREEAERLAHEIVYTRTAPGIEKETLVARIVEALSRARAAGIEEMRGRAAKATCYLCNQLYPVKRNDFTFYHEGLGICQATAIRTLAARGGEDNATQ